LIIIFSSNIYFTIFSTIFCFFSKSYKIWSFNIGSICFSKR